jgi:hypothetical protein
MPCVFELRVNPDVVVDGYTWRLDASTTVDTKEPSVTHVFKGSGAFEVSVIGHTAEGDTLPLKTIESICDEMLGDLCDPSGPGCFY